jgi:hypothetical protein
MGPHGLARQGADRAGGRDRWAKWGHRRRGRWRADLGRGQARS